MGQNQLYKSRRHAFRNQGCLCFYCKLPMWETDQEEFARVHSIRPKLAKYLKCTAEHLVAKQDNGRDSRDNIVAACLWCNRERHRSHPTKAPDPVTYRANVTRLVSKGRWHPVVASRRGRN